MKQFFPIFEKRTNFRSKWISTFSLFSHYLFFLPVFFFSLKKANWNSKNNILRHDFHFKGNTNRVEKSGRKIGLKNMQPHGWMSMTIICGLVINWINEAVYSQINLPSNQLIRVYFKWKVKEFAKAFKMLGWNVLFSFLFSTIDSVDASWKWKKSSTHR